MEDDETSRVFDNDEFGYWEITIELPGKKRDTEIVPFKYEGGIEAFISNEVLPYEPEAKIDPKRTKIGYEISFTKYFYKPAKLREVTEILDSLAKLEAEGAGLMAEIAKGVKR